MNNAVGINFYESKPLKNMARAAPLHVTLLICL